MEYLVFQPGQSFSISSSSSNCSGRSSGDLNPQWTSNDFSVLLRKCFMDNASYSVVSSEIGWCPAKSSSNSDVVRKESSDVMLSPSVEDMRKDKSSFTSSQKVQTDSGESLSFTGASTSIPKQKSGMLSLPNGRNRILQENGFPVEQENERQKIFEKDDWFCRIKHSLIDAEETFRVFVRSLYEQEEQASTLSTTDRWRYAFLLEYCSGLSFSSEQCYSQRLEALMAPVEWNAQTSAIIEQLALFSSSARVSIEGKLHEGDEETLQVTVGSSTTSAGRSSTNSYDFSAPSSLPLSALDVLREQVLFPLKEQKDFLCREIEDIKKAAHQLNKKLPGLLSRKKKRAAKLEERVRSALLADLKREDQIQEDKLKARRQKLESALASTVREKIEREKKKTKDSQHKEVVHSHDETDMDEVTQEQEEWRIAKLQDFLSVTILPEIEKLWREAIQCPPPPLHLSAQEENTCEYRVEVQGGEKDEGNASLPRSCGSRYPKEKESPRSFFRSPCPRRTTRGGISGVLEQEGWHTIYRAILLECWAQYPFYQLYGGATEGHLKSKPLHTFLKGIRGVQREAYIQEEMLRSQLSSTFMDPSAIVEKLMKKPSKEKSRPSGRTESFSLASTASIVSTSTSCTNSSSGRTTQAIGNGSSALRYWKSSDSLLNTEYSSILDYLDHNIWVTRIYQPWKKDAEFLLGAQCRVLEYLLFADSGVVDSTSSISFPEELKSEGKQGEEVLSAVRFGIERNHSERKMAEAGGEEIHGITRKKGTPVVPVNKRLNNLQLEWYVVGHEGAAENTYTGRKEEKYPEKNGSNSLHTRQGTEKGSIRGNGSSPVSAKGVRVTRYLLRCFLEHEEKCADRDAKKGKQKRNLYRETPCDSLHSEKSSRASEEEIEISTQKTVRWSGRITLEKTESGGDTSDRLSHTSSFSTTGENGKNWEDGKGEQLFTRYSANICLSKALVLPSTMILVSNPELKKEYDRWRKRLRINGPSLIPAMRKWSINHQAEDAGKEKDSRLPNVSLTPSYRSQHPLLTVRDCADKGLVQCALVFTPEGFQERRNNRAALQAIEGKIRSLQEELAEILEDNFMLERKICELEGREPVRWSDRPSLALYNGPKDRNNLFSPI